MSISGLEVSHFINCYQAIVVYAPALALIQVTGFLNGINNDVEIACFIIFLVCVFYSSIGGMKAVIWTDTFQAICMFGSFMGIIIYGSQVVGGPAKVFDINYQAGRVELFNFDPVSFFFRSNFAFLGWF